MFELEMPWKNLAELGTVCIPSLPFLTAGKLELNQYGEDFAKII